MRLSLNILSTFLNHFRGRNRKVLFSSANTHLPNTSGRRNPRVLRSRSARLHAAKSAARLRNHRSIANAAANSKRGQTTTAGTGTAHEVKRRGAKYRQARVRPLAGRKRLQQYNPVLVPQLTTTPQPPGAFIVEPAFVVSRLPGLDNQRPPSFDAPMLFFDALVKGRRAILSAEEKRNQRDEDAEYARLLEQDSKKAHKAHRRAMDAEHARKAEEARRRAEGEEFARLLEEDRRKAEEARRQATEQEEKKRQAERGFAERVRRRRERLEEEREAAQSNLRAQLCLYEEKWAFLRSNAVELENVPFFLIPWPSFEDVCCVGDITKERVIAFVRHPLREDIQCAGGGQDRSLHSEMLRWHPDRFEGTVLGKVAEGDREAAKEAAGEIARILTRLNAESAKC